MYAHFPSVGIEMTALKPLSAFSTDELLTHHDFPEYKIRVTSPQLCDPSVKQYSGYLDISDDKHLFFW